MSFLNEQIATKETNTFFRVALRIWLGVGVFLLPLFVLPLTRDAINFPKSFLLYIFVIVGLLGWFGDMLYSKQGALRHSSIDILMALFFVGFLLSTIFSRGLAMSFLGTVDAFTLNTVFVLACILWFWLMLQLYTQHRQIVRLAYTLMCSLSIVGLFFLFRNAAFLQPVVENIGWQLSSYINSNFAMLMAVGGVLSAGMLLIKEKHWSYQVVSLVAFLISFVALLTLQFKVAWVVFTVGMALLTVLGVTLLQQTTVLRVSSLFAFFLIGMYATFFSLPTAWSASLPVEIALSAQASWEIVQPAWLSGIKTFFIGSGPGSFSQSFSEFRVPAFNLDSLTWTTRFNTPFNSLFAFISETGLLGTLPFLFLLLIVSGSVFHALRRVKGAFVEAPAALSQASSPEYMMPFVFFIAWVGTTLTLFLTFADVVIWIVWWVLLALLILSLGRILTGIVQQRTFVFSLSSQYVLAFSFSLILVFFGIILLSGFGYKVYAAERAFLLANRTTVIEEREARLERATSLRPGYEEYQLHIAQHAVEKARALAASPEPDVTEVASALSVAIEKAKKVTDANPESIEAWELLAAIYMNTRSVTPEANDWALEAVSKAIALEPSNALLYWRRANIEQFAQKQEDAEASYIRAIELKPDYVPAYTELSGLYESQGEMTKAIQVFQPIMPVVQDNVELLFQLGRLFYNRNEGEDHERAQQVWERAEALDPNHSNTLYSLGLLHEREGETTEARQYFSRVKDLNPENEDIIKKIQSL